MDRGAWRATVHGVAKSHTQLSDQNKTKNKKNNDNNISVDTDFTWI